MYLRMEHENSKTRLNNYVQRNSGPRLAYMSAMICDQPQQWQSTLHFGDITFVGEKTSTKKDSEQSCARMALAHIEKKHCATEERIALFIDIENGNMSTFLKKMTVEQRQCMTDIYVVVGKHHPRANDKYPDDVKLLIVDSMANDAADCLIQVYIGMLLYRKAYDRYIIATADRFANPLIDLITKTNGMPWSCAKASIATLPEHIFGL